jgi:hypothetical protein
MALTPDQLVAKSKTEHSIQVAFFCWLGIVKLPDTHWIHAIPNGGARSAASAGRLKAEGVRTGVWDVFVPVPRRGHHGLYLEFKRPEHRTHKNGGLTQEQVEFGMQAHTLGYKMKAVYTWREAALALLEYLEYDGDANKLLEQGT